MPKNPSTWATLHQESPTKSRSISMQSKRKERKVCPSPFRWEKQKATRWLGCKMSDSSRSRSRSRRPSGSTSSACNSSLSIVSAETEWGLWGGGTGTLELLTLYQLCSLWQFNLILFATSSFLFNQRMRLFPFRLTVCRAGDARI